MTSLKNPTLGHNLTSRVMGELPDELFNFFFNPAGPAALKTCRGARQALISQFFFALRAAAVADGIGPSWEPENEEKIQQLMNRMTFTERHSDV